jgi:hypothetical protein
MSDLFYVNQLNEVKIRGKTATFEDIYQKNHVSGAYERVGGGGGGGVLPYYLKVNSVDIDEGTAGTELSGTALTFGDSTGNVSINLAKAKVLDDINTMLEAAPEAGANNVLMGYSPATKRMVRNPALAMLYTSPTANMVMTPTYLSLTGPTSTVNITPTSLRVGPSAQWILLNCTTPTNPMLSLKKSGVTLNLEFEDIQTTNNLKALAAATPGANSKMLIYNTSTKTFNHATIPSGGAVPSYVQPTKLIIPRPIAADPQSTQIDLTNTDNGVTSKLILSDRTIYMTRTDGVNPDKGAGIEIDQFVDLAGYKVPKNFRAALAETQFQHVSMTGASGSTQAKVTFLPGGATQAPYFNLPEGGKMFLQVTGLNRSNATKCYGIRLPFFGGNGNLSQYRFTLSGNADIVYSGAFSEVFVQNEKVNVYRYLEMPSNDANIKAGSYFFYISDPLAIGNFTGTIIVERLSDNYENYPVLTPT